MKICVKEPGKPLEVREVNNDLRSLQDLVGGYIEAVTLPRGDVVIICNEEGRLHGLESNICGFVGTIAWVGVKGEDFCGLDEEAIKSIERTVRLVEYAEAGSGK